MRKRHFLRLFIFLLMGKFCGFCGDLNGVEKITVGSFDADGVQWSMEIHREGETGSLVVQRKKAGQSLMIANDSSPFPLSNYGVSPKVAKKLAELYVDYEISSAPGGLEMVRQRVNEADLMAHDLRAAYSRYMDVKARPLFGTVKRDLEHMLEALAYVQKSKSLAQARRRVIKALEPLLSDILMKVANDPGPELSLAILTCASSQKGFKALYELTAVLAGRQPEQFLIAFKMLGTEDQETINEILRKAIELKLVGSLLRDRIQKML